ncbi:hypothetical protein KSB_43100 [Ktedonobacter robiniae]|uniref:Uncharacterized protein n=1 Tax=Ktedonobacter robiniae TaxID=2778365 RepID=A0ABQ3UTS6_9CHLR|nr:hypothetical protein KSB_43100 [Ktedonobacter robiniae]
MARRASRGRDPCRLSLVPMGCVSTRSGDKKVLSIEKIADDVFSILHADIPDEKQFVQGMRVLMLNIEGNIPRLRAKLAHFL